MSPASRYRLLVFDWDGTLMDSVATIVACTRRVQRELELPEQQPRSIRETIGLGLEDVFERLYPQTDRAMRHRIVESYRHHWLATYRARLVLFDGVGEILGRLAGDGHVLAVATGKSRSGLDRDLDAAGLAGRFAATRTASEAPSKPHPGMLLDLLEELEVDTGEALMIGDTSYDLEMARRAGVDGVGVLTGGHDRETLESVASLALLPSVRDLPAWLAERR